MNYRCHRQQTLFSHKWMAVESHAITLPNGVYVDDWLYLKGPDCVLVLPHDGYGNFLQLNQAKYCLPGVGFGPVAGVIEKGEAPLDAAKRELLEEAGLVAKNWYGLGEYVMEPNRMIGVAHMFLAEQCAEHTQVTANEDLEEQTPVWIERQKLLTIAGQRRTALAWALLVYRGLNFLDGTAR